ncbi:MAG: FAD-dependent oxidoreductase [Chloroflexia bacterium]|nr:FAD-dependent oxidoreductase [Chloroflexia bacterium]
MAKIMIPDAADWPLTADLVVIGGGILGCATAFYATQAGLDTVLLEKEDGLACLTTPESAEAVRAQFDDPDNVAMMKASLEAFENLSQVVGLPGYDIDFHQQGYLFMTTAADGPETLRARVQRQHSWGLTDVEYLDGDEVRRRFPYVAAEVTAATFRQRDGWLATHEATYGFAKGSTARILLQTEAVGFQMDGAAITAVQTDRGLVHTRAVVNAAGPYCCQVAGWAGVELPILLLRRQKAVVHSELIPQNAPMTIDLDTGAYWRPEAKGGLLGWAEAGEEQPAEPADHVPADWDFPAVVIEGCMRLAPFWEEVAERLTAESVHASAGQYSITPDHKPILGPVPGAAGLYLNVGYSGHGVMGAPEGSRRVVEMVLGNIAPEDNPFRLERLEGLEHGVGEQMVI